MMGGGGNSDQFFFGLKIYSFGIFGLRSVMYFRGFLSLFDRISQYCGNCLVLLWAGNF